MRILIINGPNLKYLGDREPDIYGEKSLYDIESDIRSMPDINDNDIEFFVSNSEGDIIDRIYERDYDGLIINPGAYSHYSLAILDALRAIHVPKVEVHMTNVFRRDEKRKTLVTAEGVDGVIIGFGDYVYKMALNYFL
ncbi:MAG: 3-dehydroquinate dehydratase [Ezakiella sp.]|nr:3-dehydroquinate dehydratase [Ezakiella sp.]MDY3922994.1 type II 3-dehydroquinate dehydratase [Ezakiella sp.]